MSKPGLSGLVPGDPKETLRGHSGYPVLYYSGFILAWDPEWDKFPEWGVTEEYPKWVHERFWANIKRNREEQQFPLSSGIPVADVFKGRHSIMWAGQEDAIDFDTLLPKSWRMRTWAHF